MTDQNKIVVRMAPSPTGNLHIGGIRTALFNFLFARSHAGKYILRIEDTDKERSTKEFEKNILDSFEWVGLPYDEIFRQSERTRIYVSYIKKMIDDGSAYISKEEVKEEGQRPEVIRFKNPNKKIIFEDMIRGTVEFDTTELGDFVIAKSLEEPLYHLAVVVDDHEMGVTHVIRGEEHLSNTPRQILILEALGATRPSYAHIPLILAPDRSKLSKRHGAVSVIEYKNQGFLPEAIINYLALLGWNPGTEQEIFSLNELVQIFDISKIQKGGAIFDEKKLRWINKEHIKRLSPETLSNIISEKILKKYPEVKINPDIIKIITDRIEIFSDADRLIEEGEIDYFFNEPKLDVEKIAWKTSNKNEAKTHLTKVLEILDDNDAIMKYAEEMGKGNVLWPLRYVLSGREKSPDPFTLLSLLGKETSLTRIQTALNTF